MANRFFDQFAGTLEKFVVNIWCIFTVGGTGAPTLQQWNPNTNAYINVLSANGWHGVKSIVRSGVGKYVVTFQDTYQKRVLGASPTFEAPATAAAISMNVTAQALDTAGGGTITVQFVSGAGTAVDPASGERITINFTLSNSSAL